jgi:hypothetical protein
VRRGHSCPGLADQSGSRACSIPLLPLDPVPGVFPPLYSERPAQSSICSGSLTEAASARQAQQVHTHLKQSAYLETLPVSAWAGVAPKYPGRYKTQGTRWEHAATRVEHAAADLAADSTVKSIGLKPADSCKFMPRTPMQLEDLGPPRTTRGVSSGGHVRIAYPGLCPHLCWGVPRLVFKGMSQSVPDSRNGTGHM